MVRSIREPTRRRFSGIGLVQCIAKATFLEEMAKQVYRGDRLEGS